MGLLIGIGQTRPQSAFDYWYGIEWDEEKIVWYVDDIKYHVADIASDSDKASLTQPQYLLINLAVGGHWPGDDIDDSQFPATMEVDYVRVYRQK